MESVGALRMSDEEVARSMKANGVMCAAGSCTESPYMKAPSGWSGVRGGEMLCVEHYREVVDELTESLFEHGCAPWERKP